tara:strand:- start:3 stop:212 length:210 start_codon:yes stop_codon:yes gene_type:complete
MQLPSLCLCLVLLFIVLSPGFVLNVPPTAEDRKIIPGLVGFAGFKNLTQTLVHAVIFGVLAGLVCSRCS